ncbi:MAG TPA: hypothetical protein PKH77_07975 [Anaerolineae bacterium]|nr:hypothetical protein [Anaerolineae bacterium]
MAAKDTYFVEKTDAGWLVRRRKPGGAVTLCTTTEPAAAEDIRAAMSVYPYAQAAAGELADGVADGPAQQALISALTRLGDMERKTAARRDFESCLSNLGQTALAIMAGVGTLIVVIWLIQFLLSR